MGQAESGKSTLQKQFQLFYAPASLDEERASWRAVVYFNVVRNIKRILQALDALDLGSPQAASATLPSTTDNSLDAQNETEIAEDDAIAKSESDGGLPALTNQTRTELATLKLKLSPLLSAEASLADRLSGGVQVGTLARRRGGGVYVRSGWQTTVSVSGRKRRHDEDGQEDTSGRPDPVEEELNSIARMLYAFREDVKELWAHSVVRAIIDRRKLRLQESAELYVTLLLYPPKYAEIELWLLLSALIASSIALIAFQPRTTFPQRTTFYAHACRQWVSPHTSSWYKSPAKAFSGIFTMSAGHAASDTHGYLTSMTRMLLSSWRL